MRAQISAHKSHALSRHTAHPPLHLLSRAPWPPGPGPSSLFNRYAPQQSRSSARPLYRAWPIESDIKAAFGAHTLKACETVFTWRHSPTRTHIGAFTATHSPITPLILDEYGRGGCRQLATHLKKIGVPDWYTQPKFSAVYASEHAELGAMTPLTFGLARSYRSIVWTLLNITTALLDISDTCTCWRLDCHLTLSAFRSPPPISHHFASSHLTSPFTMTYFIVLTARPTTENTP